jgi:hypothetical protein
VAGWLRNNNQFDNQMKLIEKDEMINFQRELKKFTLSVDDFALAVTDTSDSKTDVIFALAGFVVTQQRSTNLKEQYPIVDGTRWFEEFERDIKENLFGRLGTSE